MILYLLLLLPFRVSPPPFLISGRGKRFSDVYHIIHIEVFTLFLPGVGWLPWGWASGPPLGRLAVMIFIIVIITIIVLVIIIVIILICILRLIIMMMIIVIIIVGTERVGCNVDVAMFSLTVCV